MTIRLTEIWPIADMAIKSVVPVTIDLAIIRALLNYSLAKNEKNKETRTNNCPGLFLEQSYYMLISLMHAYKIFFRFKYFYYLC